MANAKRRGTGEADPFQLRAVARLKSIIEERGLTETDVAEKSGFTQGHVWKFLHGNPKETAFWVVARIAVGLRVSLDWLVEEAPAPKAKSEPPPATGTGR